MGGLNSYSSVAYEPIQSADEDHVIQTVDLEVVSVSLLLSVGYFMDLTLELSGATF